MDTQTIIDLITTYGPDVLTILATGALLVWNFMKNRESVTTQDEKNATALNKVVEVQTDIEAIKQENTELKNMLKESVQSNNELKKEISDLKVTIILRGGIDGQTKEVQ